MKRASILFLTCSVALVNLRASYRGDFMAYGELTVRGTDVLEALTTCNGLTRYERVLNDAGEELAQLIAKHVLLTLQAKLSQDLVKED